MLASESAVVGGESCSRQVERAPGAATTASRGGRGLRRALGRAGARSTAPRFGKKSGTPRVGRRYATARRGEPVPEMNGFPSGTPGWTDLAAPDVDAATRFYEGLFGWESFSPGPEDLTGGYRIFTKGGRQVAGYGPPGPGEPPSWPNLRDRRRRGRHGGEDQGRRRQRHGPDGRDGLGAQRRLQ